VSLNEAKAICHGRPEEDFMRPVAEMDAIAQRHIDVQDLQKIPKIEGKSSL